MSTSVSHMIRHFAIGFTSTNHNLSKLSTLTSISYPLSLLQKRMTSTGALDIFEAMEE